MKLKRHTHLTVHRRVRYYPRAIYSNLRGKARTSLRRVPVEP